MLVPKIHSFLFERLGGFGGNADVLENNRLFWPSAPAQQRSHFPNPVGVFRQEKERQRKRGQESLGLIQKTVWLLGPGRGEREAKGRIVPQ